ncbi:MAG: hypothetical protein Q4G04_04915 [bacterium]|nr:hypothetical protein [bacterium]
MLKSAIYCNFFILLIISIFFMIRIFKQNSDLKKIRKLVIIYIIFNFIISLNAGGIVDIDWDIFFLFPISVISFIIHILSICCINRKIKKANNTVHNDLSIKKYIILGIIPVVVFLIPYMYELYVINNCNYLLKYNYQSGIVISEDTYIAIINNKPVSITLRKNLFNRKGFSTNNELNYNIIYTNGIEISTRDSKYNKVIIENEDIKKIALDAKERFSSAKEAYIDYFFEANFAIILLTSEVETEEYFYHDNTYIKTINTHGDLESVTYYK